MTARVTKYQMRLLAHHPATVPAHESELVRAPHKRLKTRVGVLGHGGGSWGHRHIPRIGGGILGTLYPRTRAGILRTRYPEDTAGIPYSHVRALR